MRDAGAGLDFTGRVAIVTGAGRGLGEAYAKALAARGAAVVVNDTGCAVSGDGADPQVAERVAAALREAGGRAVAHAGEVTDPDEAADLVRLATTEFGGLHVIVTNAAIRRGLPFTTTTVDDVEAHLAADLTGAQLLCQQAWDVLASGGYGRIVVSSSSAILGSARALPYALAKGAVTVLGRSMALHAAAGEADIRVNIVAPYALTRMLVGVFAADPAAQALRERYGDPARVAETVVALAHEHCPVNGGFYSVGAGQVKRILMAETSGIAGLDLTAEDLLDRWDEIESTEGMRIVTEDTAEYSHRVYRRAEQLWGAS